MGKNDTKQSNYFDGIFKTKESGIYDNDRNRQDLSMDSKRKKEKTMKTSMGPDVHLKTVLSANNKNFFDMSTPTKLISNGMLPNNKLSFDLKINQGIIDTTKPIYTHKGFFLEGNNYY